jgi:hypothetical protein
MTLCQELLRQGKPILTFQDPANRPLLDAAAQPIDLSTEWPLPSCPSFTYP